MDEVAVTFERVYDCACEEPLCDFPSRTQELEKVVRIQRTGCGSESRGRAIATPRPCLRQVDESGTHRIENDVDTRLEEVLIAFDHLRIEPTPKNVPSSVVPSVEVLRI